MDTPIDVSLALGPAFAAQKEKRAQLLKYKNKRGTAEAKRLASAADRYVARKSLPDIQWITKAKLIHLREFIGHMCVSSAWSTEVEAITEESAEGTSESTNEDNLKAIKGTKLMIRGRIWNPSKTVESAYMTKTACLEWITSHSSPDAADEHSSSREPKVHSSQLCGTVRRKGSKCRCRSDPLQGTVATMARGVDFTSAKACGRDKTTFHPRDWYVKYHTYHR